MAEFFFISDLHLGHRAVLNFAGEFRGSPETIEEHDQWVVDQINSVVSKRDILYLLGDLAFSEEGLSRISRIKGQKFVLLGNHDKFPVKRYMEEGLTPRPGLLKYKGFWLSHCPIHPKELRGIQNVHGHVHQQTLMDSRYINVCVEALNGVPLSLSELKEKSKVMNQAE